MSIRTVILDTTGRIRYANEAVFQQSGFARAQVIDRKPKDIWGGHMPRSVYTQVWETLSQGAPYIVSMKNISRQGTSYLNQFHMIPIHNVDQTKTYYAGIDVTQDKRNTASFSKEFLSLWRSHDSKAQRRWWHMLFGSKHQEDTLFDWINNTWILPTKKQFTHRYADQILITNAQKDTTAFGKLYTKYYQDVYKYLLSRVFGNENIAEDLTQETFLQAFRYLSTYTAGYASYKTYLYRVAHSRLVNHLRSKEQRTCSLSPLHEKMYTTTTQTDTIDCTLLLTQAKQLLSTAEYQAIESFYIHQESIREISIGMTRSQNAVKLLLSRARKKLAKQLSSV